jgi:hypothetical protein
VFANAGPTCTVNATGYGCPLVNIADGSGALVWSSAAPISTGCPSQFTGPTLVPANWTQTFSVSWGQTLCVPGPEPCDGETVPAGQYQVSGLDHGGSSQIPGAAPVTVTLAAASP